MTCCPTCRRPLEKETRFMFDMMTGWLVSGEREVRLEPRVAEVLQVLRDKYPAPARFTYIIDRINGQRADQVFDDNCLAVAICKLRKAIKDMPIAVKNNYGTSYQLVYAPNAARL